MSRLEAISATLIKPFLQAEAQPAAAGSAKVDETITEEPEAEAEAVADTAASAVSI